MEAKVYWRKKDRVFVIITDAHVYAFTADRLLKRLSRQLEYQLDCDPASVGQFLSSFKEIEKENLFFGIFSLLGKYL